MSSLISNNLNELAIVAFNPITIITLAYLLNILSIYYVKQQQREQEQLAEALKSNKDEFTYETACKTCNKKYPTIANILFNKTCSCHDIDLNNKRNLINGTLIFIAISPLLVHLNYGYALITLCLLLCSHTISLVDLKLKLIPTYSCFIMFLFLEITGNYIYIDNVFYLFILISLFFIFIFSLTEKSNGAIGNGDLVFISIIGAYFLSLDDSKFLFPLYILIVAFYSLCSSRKSSTAQFALGPALHFGLVICIGLYNFYNFWS